MNDVEEHFYDSLEDENYIERPSWNPNPPFLIDLPYFIKGEYNKNRSSIEIINQMFQNAKNKNSESKNTKKNQNVQQRNTNTLSIKNLSKFNQTIQNQNPMNNTTDIKNIRRSQSVNIKLKSPKEIANKTTNKKNLQNESDLIEYYESKLKELKQKNSKYTVIAADKDAQASAKYPNKAEVSPNDDKYTRAKKRDHQNYLRSFRSKSSISERSFNQFNKLLHYEFSALESNKNIETESDEQSSSTDASKKCTSYASEIETSQSNLDSIEIKSNHSLLNSGNEKERQIKSPNSISDSEDEPNRRAPHTSRSQCRKPVQKNIQSVRKISKARVDSYLEIYQQRNQQHNGTRRVSKSPKKNGASSSYPKMESLELEEQQLYQNILNNAEPSKSKPENTPKIVKVTGSLAPIPPRYSSLGPDIEEIKEKAKKVWLQKQYGQQASIRNRQRIIQNKLLNEFNKLPDKEIFNLPEKSSSSPPPFQPPLIKDSPRRKTKSPVIVKRGKKKEIIENKALSKIKLQILQARNEQEAKIANEIRFSLANQTSEKKLNKNKSPIF